MFLVCIQSQHHSIWLSCLCCSSRRQTASGQRCACFGLRRTLSQSKTCRGDGGALSLSAIAAKFSLARLQKAAVQFTGPRAVGMKLMHFRDTLHRSPIALSACTCNSRCSRRKDMAAQLIARNYSVISLVRRNIMHRTLSFAVSGTLF